MQSLKFFYTVLWQIFSSFTNVKDIDMFLPVRGATTVESDGGVMSGCTALALIVGKFFSSYVQHKAASFYW